MASFEDELSLQQYLRDIEAYPVLSREEVEELARRVRAGDEDAIETLVHSHLRFAVSVAREYETEGLSLSDLINEANLGLIRAAHKFDETNGIAFASYADALIRESILRALPG